LHGFPRLELFRCWFVVEFAVGIHLRDLYFLSAFEGDDVRSFCASNSSKPRSII
jgi:hypothetical protein